MITIGDALLFRAVSVARFACAAADRRGDCCLVQVPEVQSDRAAFAVTHATTASDALDAIDVVAVVENRGRPIGRLEGGHNSGTKKKGRISDGDTNRPGSTYQ